jgi:hypothetical protein
MKHQSEETLLKHNPDVYPDCVLVTFSLIDVSCFTGVVLFTKTTPGKHETSIRGNITKTQSG